jgi:anti-sigma factor RsiW
MNCRKATTLIIDYLSGALDLQTRAVWSAHLDDCRDCVSFLETYRKSVEALRSLPSKEISLEARNRIQRFLEGRIKYSSLAS